MLNLPKNFQKTLETQGFVVLDNFLTPEQVQILTQSYHHSIPDDILSRSVGYTGQSSDLSYRKKVYEIIKQNLQKPVHSFFPEYYIRSGAFFHKTECITRHKTGVPIHQHPIPVDETKFKSYVVWCPLIDVNENNGCLQVIKGSHLLNRFVKIAGGNCDIPYNYLKVMKDYFVSVPMKVGQGLIFDEKLLHGSFPNMSQNERIALFAMINDPKTSSYYCHPDDRINPNKYEVFEIEAGCYHKFLYETTIENIQKSPPEYIKNITIVKHEPISSSMTKKEILETLSQNESNNNAMSNFFKQIKINIQVIRLNIEEQIFNLKEKLKRGLKNIFKIRGVS